MTRRTAALALAVAVLAAPLGAGTSAADPDPAAGKLVLVLDSSGSMKEPAGDGGTKIAAAKTALGRVVGRLPESANVGLRVYGATVFERGQAGACTDSQLAVPIGTGNRAALRAAIARYKPYGETPIAYALQQAANDLGSEGKRSILLVSDGEATCQPDPCTVAREIAAKGIDLKIDVVGFRVGTKARAQLRCVAKAGRGDYYDADSTEDLEAGLDRLSTRAFRPFRISGQPVVGTPQPEGAPEIAPGLYSDTFGVGKAAKYYRIRRSIARSTLRAGVSFRSPAERSKIAQAKVELKTPEGDSCGWSYPTAFNVSTSEALATGSSSSWSTWNDKCADAAEMVLSVSVGERFEDLARAAFELQVAEEPPVSTTAGLPGEAGNPVWTSMSGSTPRRVVPGSSFADAPLIGPGSHGTTLMPGELQLYKVRLDWGQRLQAQIGIPQLNAATAKAVGSVRYVDATIISPSRGEAYAVFSKKAPGSGGRRGVVSKNGMVQGVLTKEIRYNNRDGANNEDHDTSVPGEYYLAVVLSKDADDEQPFTVPVTLTIGVYGEAGTGRPSYTEEPAADPGSSPTSSESPSDPPSETPTGSSSDSGTETEAGGPVSSDESGDDATPVAAVAVLGGGGVLLAALAVGAILLLRRNRPVR